MSSSAHRLNRVPAVLLIFGLLLSCFACKRGTSSKEKETPAPTLAELTPSPAPIAGGELILPIPENEEVSNPDYNPLLVTTEETLNMYSLAYEPLIAIDETNMIVPCLAINWSKDASTPNSWLISLRHEAYWHSGRKFDSADVIYSYNSLKALGSASYYSSCLDYITAMEAVDEYTVRAVMKSSGMMCLYALSFPILREGGAEFEGTGAYKLKEIGDGCIELAVNHDWWDREPYIEAVRFEERSSNDTALASYSAGQLNFVPTASLTVGQYSELNVTNVIDIMTQSMEALLVNYDRPLVSDVRFRQALARGIDRIRIITNVYMNRARACDVPVPPDSWLYDGRYAEYAYDPQAANALLDDMRLSQRDDEGMRLSAGSPIKLTLLTSSTADNTTRADAAKLMAEQLEALGISVEIVTAAHGIGGEEDSEFITALKAGNWDIALVGFNLAQCGDLSSYLDAAGANNYGGYSSDTFFTLMNQMLEAGTEEELRAASGALQEAFISELPFITLYFRLNSIVYSADIAGVGVVREPAVMRGIKNWYFSP